MKSTKYRPLEEQPKRLFNAQGSRQRIGWGKAGTVLSPQIMLLTEVIAPAAESKEITAVVDVVDLSQEATNIMKLACSVSLRQSALGTSSKTAQAVMRQF